MDWVITVELQFPNEGAQATIDQARAYAKHLLEVCIQEHYLTHYHLLGEPRQVDS